MLSDEEKKAIEKIKKILYMFPESEELKLLLNLIEKQSKEIEELKEVKWYYEISRVPKDKIKALLENEIINISGFECVAKGDVQSLLEKE